MKNVGGLRRGTAHGGFAPACWRAARRVAQGATGPPANARWHSTSKKPTRLGRLAEIARAPSPLCGSWIDGRMYLALEGSDATPRRRPGARRARGRGRLTRVLGGLRERPTRSSRARRRCGAARCRRLARHCRSPVTRSSSGTACSAGTAALGRDAFDAAAAAGGHATLFRHGPARPRCSRRSRRRCCASTGPEARIRSCRHTQPRRMYADL